MDKIWEKIKMYKAIIGFCVLVAGVAFAGYKFNDDVKKTKNKQISYEESMVKQVELTNKIANQFELILQLYGVDEAVIQEYKAIPREPAVDSLGNIIKGSEWLVVSDDYKVGTKVKCIMSPTEDELGIEMLQEQILWNFRKE